MRERKTDRDRYTDRQKEGETHLWQNRSNRIAAHGHANGHRYPQEVECFQVYTHILLTLHRVLPVSHIIPTNPSMHLQDNFEE